VRETPKQYNRVGNPQPSILGQHVMTEQAAGAEKNVCLTHGCFACSMLGGVSFVFETSITVESVFERTNNLFS